VFECVVSWFVRSSFKARIIPLEDLTSSASCHSLLSGYSVSN
jgi:hypothetical protein